MINIYNFSLSCSDLLLILVLLACCYTDVRAQKIHNAVIFPSIAAAFAVNVISGGLDGCLESVKGLFLGIALLFIPFAAGGIGAGDVKLLGTIGAYKGPEFVFVVFLTAALAGGIFSVVILARRGMLLLTVKKIYYLLLNKVTGVPVAVTFNKLETAAKGDSFPYAVAIGLGVLGAYVLGWLECGIL